MNQTSEHMGSVEQTESVKYTERRSRSWQKTIKFILKSILALTFAFTFITSLGGFKITDVGIMAGVVLLWTFLAIHDELAQINDKLN